MTWDAVVMGAGPAGCSVARLLAKWGHRVLLYHDGQEGQRAESLPPSIGNLFELFGIRENIQQAGFYPDGGNTSWWAGVDPRVEHFARGATGYHVWRPDFNALLRRLAVDSGATLVTENPENHPRKFLVDCTGRRGLLQYRIADKRYRTVCLSAMWTGDWHAEPHHALIEAYADGWAWSVPISDNQRQVSFMVDHGRKRGGVRQAYLDELAKTRVFKELAQSSEIDDQPHACDASLYHSSEYAGDGWILVGDAGSAIDPLSSFGVKKALISSWMAAVVVNTCLTRPDMTGAAIALYNERERQTYADHARQAATQFGELVTRFPTPFWQQRAVLAPDLRLYEPADLIKAHENLRASPRVCLRLAQPPREESFPAIEGREIRMTERTVLTGLPPSVEYAQGVQLVQLALIAERHDDVPAMFDAYNRTATPVALSNFISALSLLIANGILISNANADK